MEEKNTKKKNLVFSMLFSLLCVFLVTIPTLTFAWFKQYMDVTSKTITITSGESVAYIEIEIYTYQNKTINGPLAFHTSLDYDLDANCTSNADGSGVVNVSFNSVTVNETDLTLGYGGLNNPDFFNPNCLPEFMIEFRIIKELFSSYVKSSVTVLANSGTNVYNVYNASDKTSSESTSRLTTPFLFRQGIFANDPDNVVGSCIQNTSNVANMHKVLPSSLPTVNSETNIFKGLGSLSDQGATGLQGNNYAEQLYVPQFNKKKPGSENDIAYSKAIIYDVCLDPALILFTMQETNKGTYSKSMSFNLSLQFSFELSNDPFRA